MALISQIYTLRQAANMLGATVDEIYEAAIGMFADDGCIRIIDESFTEDDWPIASAFTDEGLENLQYILEVNKRSRSQQI